jgi:hypothetical protein
MEQKFRKRYAEGSMLLPESGRHDSANEKLKISKAS